MNDSNSILEIGMVKLLILLMKWLNINYIIYYYIYIYSKKVYLTTE